MTEDLGQPGYRGTLSENGATIAEVLRPAGYRTFVSGKWHVGTNDPTARGFEEFYGTLVSAPTFWDPARYLRLPATHKARTYDPGTFYGTDALTDHALDFLGQARTTPENPWFLYLAYNSPHFPLHAPQAEIEKYQERDPLKLFSATLLEEKIVDENILAKMDQDIHEEVEQSVKFAEESPLPPPEDLFTDVYANPITPGRAK